MASNTRDSDEVYEEGTAMPGFIRLAVCSAEEASGNKGRMVRYET